MTVAIFHDRAPHIYVSWGCISLESYKVSFGESQYDIARLCCSAALLVSTVVVSARCAVVLVLCWTHRRLSVPSIFT